MSSRVLLKIFGLTIILGFLLSSIPLLGFSKTKTSRHTRKRTSTINIQKRDLDRQLQQSLENIAFSPNYFDSRSAMDFLLDHPDLSLTPLQGFLENSNVPSANLINIWNIVQYILDDAEKPRLSCEKIQEIMAAQSEKQDFLTQIIDDNLPYCQDLEKPIQSWLHNSSVLKYEPAFLLIQKHHLLSFSSSVFRETLSTINPMKREMGLSTLLSLAPENLNTTAILPFFSSNISTIRYKTAKLFWLYKNTGKLLIDQYHSSDSDLEKSSIIYALVQNSSDEVFDFVIKLYPKEPQFSTEISLFFLNQITTSQRMEKFLNLFKKSHRESFTLNLLYVTYSLVPHFSDKPQVLQKIESTLQEQMPKEQNSISRFIKKIQDQIHLSSRGDFSTNN